MRKSVFAITLIAVLSIALAILSGCKKDDNVVQPGDEFAPVTALKALSGNGSVMLMWTASTSASSEDFRNYRITTKLGATTVKTDSTTANSFTVSGLTNGASYNFFVNAVKTSGALSTETQIGWGPAVRYTAARIYEFDSPNPSGLVFSTGSQLAFVAGNKASIDLWIDGQGGTTPALKSPDQVTTSTGWHSTGLAQSAVGGTASLNTYADYPSASAITSSSLSINAGNVYFAKTFDGHYVRFTTSAVQGTAPNRYVDVDVSYNEGLSAWAKR